MKQQTFSFAGRASNPVKASPAQLAARKRFAEMARSGAFKKATKRKANPGTSDATLANWLDRIASGQTYNETKLKEALQHPGVTAEDKIVIRDALKGAPYSHTDLNQAAINIRNKRKTNPISGVDAGEFAMTVNGKTIHRFFVHTSDPWAKSHGFDYQLVSNVTKNGAFVKFTKTRAIVAVDEAADGSAVTEKWEIRNLVFYKTNPAKKTVSQKISQLVHEGYPQRQAVAVALSEQRAGKVKRNPMHRYTVLHRGTANIAGQVTASGPQDAKQKVAAKLGIPTLAYLVAKKTNPANVKQITEFKGHKDYTGYAVREPGSDKYIAVFASKKQAVALAQNQADYHNKNMEVARIQLVRTK